MLVVQEDEGGGGDRADAPGAVPCDGGLLVDLRLRSGIRIDPDARVAGAQAGVLLGELDAATQEHGLAVPAGIVSHTGLAGLTLGGGTGWLERKYGLTVDSLSSAEAEDAGEDAASGLLCTGLVGRAEPIALQRASSAADSRNLQQVGRGVGV